jgi:hypothetical protein
VGSAGRQLSGVRVLDVSLTGLAWSAAMPERLVAALIGELGDHARGTGTDQGR